MTPSRVGLLALVVGVLVGARGRRRGREAAATRAEVSLLARGSATADRALHAEVAATERRGRRRAALLVAFVAIASLPPIALATRTDVEPLAVALLVGAYALGAIVALLVATRLTPGRR